MLIRQFKVIDRIKDCSTLIKTRADKHRNCKLNIGDKYFFNDYHDQKIVQN